MKKFICFLTLLVFAFTSCEQDEIIDPTSNQEEELIGISLKGKKGKVTICHKGKSITVNGNALKAHLKHGDVQLIDADGDGWVTFENECMDGGDCDDTNPDVNPGAIEIPYNGLDDDCDPETLDDDLDGDGFLNADDCDDDNEAINPDVEDICDNGIDDNCNGEIDEGCIQTVAIGDYYQGGVVFYIATPDNLDLYVEGEQHGMICAIVDQGEEVSWYTGTVQWTGSGFESIGAGEQNTEVLISFFGDGSYAAKVCDEYSVTVGGVEYNDWFLPSIDELEQVARNKAVIDETSVENGGTALRDYFYWSSTQLNVHPYPVYTWLISDTFNESSRSPFKMDYEDWSVRAVRYF